MKFLTGIVSLRYIMTGLTTGLEILRSFSSSSKPSDAQQSRHSVQIRVFYMNDFFKFELYWLNLYNMSSNIWHKYIVHFKWQQRATLNPFIYMFILFYFS